MFEILIKLSLLVTNSVYASCSGLAGETLAQCLGDEHRMLREYHVRLEKAMGKKIFIEHNGKRTTVTEDKIIYDSSDNTCELTRKIGQIKTFYEDGKLRSIENCTEVTHRDAIELHPYKKIVRHGDYISYYSDGKTKRVQGKAWCGYDLQRGTWDEMGKPLVILSKENPVTAYMRERCTVK